MELSAQRHRQSFFFFLMIRRPPRSTLFPTRRSSDLGAVRHRSLAAAGAGSGRRPQRRLAAGVLAGRRLLGPAAGRHLRSEEHTSEFQSRQYLVCRLLLEKKTYNTLQLLLRNSLLVNS